MAQDSESGENEVSSYRDDMESIVDGWNTMYRRIEKMRTNILLLKSLLRGRANMSDEEIISEVVRMGGWREEVSHEWR